MRILHIKSTRAAYERLPMLKYPEVMAIPFDPDKISPFGIRVNTLSNGYNRITLTLGDQDIGLVSHFNDDGVRLELAFDANERVADAIKRAFTIINNHTAQVARVLADERRILKTDAQSPEAARVREEKRQRDHALDAAMTADLVQERRNQESRSCGRWGAPREGLAVIRLEGLTLEDIRTAQKFARMGDDMEISLEQWDDDQPPNVARIEVKCGKVWHFLTTDEGLVLHGEHAFVPDVHKIVPHIQAIADRNRRLDDPAYVTAPLAQLPAAEYAIERYTISDVEAERGSARTFANPQKFPLTENAELLIVRDLVMLRVEDVQMAEWKIWKHQPVLDHAVRFHSRRSGDDGLFGTADVLARIGDFWLREHLAPQGVDITPFRPFDLEEIEEEATRANFGYVI